MTNKIEPLKPPVCKIEASRILGALREEESVPPRYVRAAIMWIAEQSILDNNQGRFKPGREKQASNAEIEELNGFLARAEQALMNEQMSVEE